jgi:hypothetical protein
MGFAHAQANIFTTGGGVSSISVSFTNNPAPGDVVCVEVETFLASGITLTSVKDGNNNSFIISPNSPTSQATVGSLWLAYLIAPSNANKTITASFSTPTVGGCAITADDFSVSGGSGAFDKDGQSSSATGATPYITPSLTPAGSSELFYACADGNSFAFATSSPWVQCQNLNGFGITAYILSVGSAQAVDWTWSGGSQAICSIAMCFSFSASGGTAINYVRQMMMGVGQ